MKLKNSVIKALVENGLQNTTDHSVDCKHAYKVYKFRHEILNAAKDIDSKRQGLVESAGIEEPKKFDERRRLLSAKTNRTAEEQKELEEMEAKFKRFADLFAELMNDETELNVKAIPYEEYHKLANENRATPVTRMVDGEPKTISVDIFTAFRDELKDVLWAAPVEND